MAKSYKLSAKNFQSWAGFDLPMTGFTVITGPSDRGKSAIIRSLRGVLRNQVGANHITLGEKTVSVSLDVSGTPIELSRNAKTTTYTVGGEEYAKLAGEVPPVVKDMGFNEVEVNGVKLDPIFAGQFDSQFMLDLSPAELNSIFGLFSSTEKLNAGKKVASSRNLEFNATAKFLASEILEAEGKKGKLSSLTDEIEAESQQIFTLESDYNSIVTSYNLLIKLLESRKRAAHLKKISSFQMPSTSDLVDTLNHGRMLVQYSKRKKNLGNIRAVEAVNIPNCTGLTKELQTIIKLIRVQKVSSRLLLLRCLPPSSIANPLESVINSIKKVGAYIAAVERVDGLKSSIDSSNKQVKALTDDLSELEGSSIQCPKCGHFFTGENHEHE